MFVKILICSLFLIAINITDIKGYKIKNTTVIPTIFLGLILGIINHSVLDSLYGLLIPLILFPLFALKMLGAGDIKALCAIGAVVGYKISIMTVIFTFLSGGVIALCFMIFNKNFTDRFKNLFIYLKISFITKKMDKYNYGGNEKSYFRFSYAITTGTILALINNYFGII